MLWGKTIAESSNACRAVSRAAEAYDRVFFGSIILALYFACSATSTFGQDASPDSPIFFDIPQQRADQALIQFAEQANLTLFFPFDEVRQKTANRLVGEYAKQEAAAILLAGTGFRATFSEPSVLRIDGDHQPDSDWNPVDVEKKSGVFGFLGNLFDDGDSNQQFESIDTPIENIIVSGTRLARSGYDTPTPVTVLGTAELEADAPHNVADIVNQLPAVVGSTTPDAANLSISAGGAGINGINLRSLGRERTLVLVNGRRAAAAAKDGVVDINTIPQPLVERVEVVTGGASAVYGSDAVTGIVNFILDDDYTGIKADVSTSTTTYGDDDQIRVTLTAGTELFDGRGHIVASGEVADKDGIFGVPRSWNNGGQFTMFNPNYAPGNGEPEMLRLPQVGLSTGLAGGIITDTALRGTAFGTGGVPFQFQYGDLVRDPWMRGGDWRLAQTNNKVTLSPEMKRQSIYTKITYEFTEDVEGFVEYSNGRSRNHGWCCAQFNVANINIQADNAFIPEEVAAQMTAMGITEFTLGSMNGDLFPIRSRNTRDMQRFTAGLSGNFDMFGSNWTFDIYAQRGVTDTVEDARTTNRSHYTMALDAVRDPVSGQIVCRSTLTDPNNGCKPYNPMGVGVNSQATVDYLYFGDGVDANTIGPIRHQEFTQEVYAVEFSGSAFSLPAGDVALAFGLEHRTEEASGVADSVSATAGWFNGNYLPLFGEYDVTEGFLEVLVPIIEDRLDLNGAVRATDYSTSGNVTTWKIGATFSPVGDLRLRATLSRDIRAPNLGELFEAGGAQTNSVSDPFNNNQTVQFLGLISGNPDLQPEEADTFGIGLIWQPSFLPDLRMSVDYYDIEINDAISSLSVQSIVDRCFEGNQSFCDAITRGIGPFGTNQILEVRRSPFNFVTVNASGIDFAADYAVGGFLGGDWLLKLVATHYLEEISDDGITVPFNTVGQVAGSDPPDWLGRASVTYSRGAWTTTLTARGISEGVHDNRLIVCTSDCPDSTAPNRTVNRNDIGGALFLDLSATYSFQIKDAETEAYFVFRNILNNDPPVLFHGPGGVSHQQIATNPNLYDLLGTVIRVGVRIEF